MELMYESKHAFFYSYCYHYIVNTMCRHRCKITALKGFLYTDGPFRAVSRTVQILTIWADKSRAKILPFYDVFFQTNFSPPLSYSSIFYTFKKTSKHQHTTKQYFRKMKNNFKELHIVYTFIVLGYGHTRLGA